MRSLWRSRMREYFIRSNCWQKGREVVTISFSRWGIGMKRISQDLSKSTRKKRIAILVKSWIVFSPYHTILTIHKSQFLISFVSTVTTSITLHYARTGVLKDHQINLRNHHENYKVGITWTIGVATKIIIVKKLIKQSTNKKLQKMLTVWLQIWFMQWSIWIIKGGWGSLTG